MKISTKLLFAIASIISSSSMNGMQQPTNPKLQEELNAAAKAGDIAGVDAALQKGADLNWPLAPLKETALHAAATAGMVDVVEKLLNTKGIKFNPQDAEKKTPLHKAIAAGDIPHFKILEIFVKHKDFVAPDLEDNKGNTILHVAVIKSGWTYEEYFIPKILEMINMDINALNNEGKTPLHLAIEFNQHGKAALLILQPNIDLRRTDHEGNTPLHGALKDNVNARTVNALIKRDDSVVNLQNRAGLTPLHVLVETMNKDESLAKGREIEDPTKRLEEDQRLKEDKEAALLLFNTKKILPALRTKEGKTALELAEGVFTKKTIGELIDKAEK